MIVSVLDSLFVEAIRRLAPCALIDTIPGVDHAGILLQRVKDFDRQRLRVVSRFAALARENDH